MNTEIKLWREYKKFVKKNNESYYKAFKKLLKEKFDRPEYDTEQYEKDLKRWESRSCFGRFLNVKPLKRHYKFSYNWYIISLNFEQQILILKITYNFISEPNWEGFLDWRLKKKI